MSIFTAALKFISKISPIGTILSGGYKIYRFLTEGRSLFKKLPFRNSDKRGIEDIQQMADQMGYDLDTDSSSSQLGFLREAKNEILGESSKDYKILPQLMDELKKYKGSNKGISGYDGRY